MPGHGQRARKRIIYKHGLYWDLKDSKRVEEFEKKHKKLFRAMRKGKYPTKDAPPPVPVTAHIKAGLLKLWKIVQGPATTLDDKREKFTWASRRWPPPKDPRLGNW